MTVWLWKLYSSSIILDFFSGKKYPQPIDTYVGTLAGIEVKEYGFSRAVWQLCPVGWKKLLGGIKDQQRTVRKNRVGPFRVLRMASGRNRFWNI